MTTAILRLVAPLQSWGATEGSEYRRINRFPTRSGILGMLSNAAGLSREDSVSPWERVRVGVRIDQAGTLVEDYHTSDSDKTEKRMLSERKRIAENKRRAAKGLAPLPKPKYSADTSVTRRVYLSDASFTVVLEGDTETIRLAVDALSAPRRPLFFGRKACVPSAPVLVGVSNLSMEEALQSAEWIPYDTDPHLDEWRPSPRALTHGWGAPKITLDTYTEVDTPVAGSIMMRDVPVSLTVNDRRFTGRSVVRGSVTIDNRFSRRKSADEEATEAEIDHKPLGL